MRDLQEKLAATADRLDAAETLCQVAQEPEAMTEVSERAAELKQEVEATICKLRESRALMEAALRQAE